MASETPCLFAMGREGDRFMKSSRSILLLLPMLAMTAACARSEPVTADPDEVEAAVKEANEAAASYKDDQARPKAGESL
jgi:predicted small lipoprotein YifL